MCLFVVLLIVGYSAIESYFNIFCKHSFLCFTHISISTFYNSLHMCMLSFLTYLSIIIVSQQSHYFSTITYYLLTTTYYFSIITYFLNHHKLLLIRSIFFSFTAYFLNHCKYVLIHGSISIFLFTSIHWAVAWEISLHFRRVTWSSSSEYILLDYPHDILFVSEAIISPPDIRSVSLQTNA